MFYPWFVSLKIQEEERDTLNNVLCVPIIQTYVEPKKKNKEKEKEKEKGKPFISISPPALVLYQI
jgi:predicted nucleotide-binding protein (sugar kinase/HSP70/actin superfamily)